MCQDSRSKPSQDSDLKNNNTVDVQDSNKAAIEGAAYMRQVSTRSSYVDLVCFLLPGLLWKVTSVKTVYLTAILRIISTHAFLSLHYMFVDKDNYYEKLSQKQLQREKKDYLVGIILHMWAQIALQILFPGMFWPLSPSESPIYDCAKATFWTHVLLVEPLYYAVHRWLHVPEHMKAMHGFHHQSINTVPSTSLVQNFQEHFVYIATFGPAMILPYFVTGQQHWAVITAYLVVFDIVNAFGHTNIKLRHWLFASPFSPLRYLIYTPEFHLGHHAYYNYNFGLFMPVWDHLFGTYRRYEKPSTKALPKIKQDFVFIGHNGGLGHLLTIPEISVYNVYDAYSRTWLPVELELILVKIANSFVRMVSQSYKVSRYLVDGQFIGRIICVLRTPLDYHPKCGDLDGINNDIVKLIEKENNECGTRYFGLGNLNKMKQLNDGGLEIARMVAAHPVLKDKKIRVWTGDTMTTASVYHQIRGLPFGEKDKEIFYIGAGGKIGKAVCELLTRDGIKIVIYSKHHAYNNPLITYTSSLSDMLSYKFVLIGKLLRGQEYEKVLRFRARDQHLLDYTVPFMPIPTPRGSAGSSFHTRHVQIGVLRSTSDTFLKGYYDICMGTAQNHIYPCHAGCIVNMVEKEERDECGEIDVEQVIPLWAKATKYGLVNRENSELGM